MNFAEDRHAELHSALRHDAVVRLDVHFPGEHHGQDHDHHEDPVFREKFRCPDQHFRHDRQITAELCEGLRQRRNDDHHDHDQNDNGHAYDEDRIGQRRFDFRLRLVLLLVVLRHLGKRALDVTGFLARAKGLNQGCRKLRAVPLDAVGKSRAARDILRRLQENFPENLVLRLAADHLQAPCNRHTGAKRDGNLTAENGQVLQIDLVAADVHVPEGIAFLPHLRKGENDRCRCPDLVRRRILIRRLNHAADLHALFRQCLVLKRCHNGCPLPQCPCNFLQVFSKTRAPGFSGAQYPHIRRVFVADRLNQQCSDRSFAFCIQEACAFLPQNFSFF